jgi:hypothetical protein
MALHESWHVRNRSRECSLTQTPFVEGQPIVTALFPDPDSSGYLRKDFCEDAWKNRDSDAETPFSNWRTKFQPTPVNDTQPAVTKQTAEELLTTLVEEDQEHTENTRYILAVMLERQKLLRETDTQPTSGGTLRIYEHRKTGEVYIVKDPNIPLSEVEKIQEEVIAMLSPKPAYEEPAPATENEATEAEAGTDSTKPETSEQP